MPKLLGARCDDAKTPLLMLGRGVFGTDFFVYCVSLEQGNAPAGAPKGFPIALWKPSVPLLLGLLAVGLCQDLKNQKYTNSKAAITTNKLRWGCEAVQGAIADFVCFHCPLVAPAGAKSCINTRKLYEEVTNSIARKGQGRNSLAGCRDSVPAGVQRQSLWGGFQQ